MDSGKRKKKIESEDEREMEDDLENSNSGEEKGEIILNEENSIISINSNTSREKEEKAPLRRSERKENNKEDNVGTPVLRRAQKKSAMNEFHSERREIIAEEISEEREMMDSNHNVEENKSNQNKENSNLRHSVSNNNNPDQKMMLMDQAPGPSLQNPSPPASSTPNKNNIVNRLMIERVELLNFKSYAGKKCIGPLHKVIFFLFLLKSKLILLLVFFLNCGPKWIWKI